MIKLTTGILLLAVCVLFSSEVYGCDWVRYHYSYPVVLQPQPVVVNTTSYVNVPTVVYQPVIVQQPVPVVEQRVLWVWPNYYTYPVYPRPTYIRY